VVGLHLLAAPASCLVMNATRTMLYLMLCCQIRLEAIISWKLVNYQWQAT